MKRLCCLLLVFVMFSSCQDEDRKELMEQPVAEKVPDSIQVLQGEFVLGSSRAILRGEDFVYAVKIDSMSRVLARKIDSFKKDDFDMVPVTVKGKIAINPLQGGLDEIVEIQEIIGIPGKETDTIENKK